MQWHNYSPVKRSGVISRVKLAAGPMFLKSVAVLLFAGVLSAQAGVPPDRLELVTGRTEIPQGPQQRGAVVSLLENTLANHNLHLRGNHPYDLQVTFTAAASTLYPAGSGTLEESWVSGQHWRWTAALGGYSQLQIGSDQGVYGQSQQPMPMRLKTVREVLFAPVVLRARQVTIRTASASMNGTALTCILTSAGSNPQVAADGRQWYETEYCIDPATSTLRVFSLAPGIYVAYDYANGHKFHDHLLPGKITVTENGATTVDAQINSVADADANNVALYQPTGAMIAQGAAPVAGMAERFPILIPSTNGTASSAVEHVIVHATLDRAGKILELEALQTNSSTLKALQHVMATTFGALPTPQGASPLLREAYINVRVMN